MDVTALLRNKKIIILILILTIPLWLPILNYIVDFIFEAGKILGTYVRIVGSGEYCTF